MTSSTGDDINAEYWQMSGTSTYFEAVDGDGKPVMFKFCDGPFVAILLHAIQTSNNALPLPLNRKDSGTRYEVGKWGDFRPYGTGDGISAAIKASSSRACMTYTALWSEQIKAVRADYRSRYEASEHGQAVIAAWRGSEHGQAVRSAWRGTYEASEHGQCGWHPVWMAPDGPKWSDPVQNDRTKMSKNDRLNRGLETMKAMLLCWFFCWCGSWFSIRHRAALRQNTSHSEIF